MGETPRTPREREIMTDPDKRLAIVCAVFYILGWVISPLLRPRSMPKSDWNLYTVSIWGGGPALLIVLYYAGVIPS